MNPFLRRVANTLFKGTFTATVFAAASCGAVLPESSSLLQPCGSELVGAVIGPAGGVLKISAAGSPYNGVELAVPAGALATPVRISIASGDPMGQASDQPLSPSVCLLPIGLSLAQPATLSLPIDPIPWKNGVGAWLAAHDNEQDSLSIPPEQAPGTAAGSAQLSLTQLKALQFIRKGTHSNDIKSTDVVSYLFVISDAPSMEAKQQQLATRMDKFFNVLSTAQYLSMKMRSPSQWRAGIITGSAIDSTFAWDPNRAQLVDEPCTKRGLTGAAAAQCKRLCTGVTKPTILKNRRYLSSDDLTPANRDEMQRWFQCLAIVGAAGSDYQMPQANILKVADRIAKDPGTEGYSGFVAAAKASRQMVIVEINDQDDCSLPELADPKAILGVAPVNCGKMAGRADLPQCYPREMRCLGLALKCGRDPKLPQDLTNYSQDQTFTDCTERTAAAGDKTFLLEVRAGFLATGTPLYKLIDLTHIAVTGIWPEADRSEQAHQPDPADPAHKRNIAFCAARTAPYLTTWPWCRDSASPLSMGFPQIRSSLVTDWLDGTFQAPTKDTDLGVHYEMSICQPNLWLSGFCSQIADLFNYPQMDPDRTKFCLGL